MSEGVNSYSLGYQNKVERSATGVSALVQAFKARLLPLIESLNEALSNIAEQWISLSSTIMDEEITVRTFDKEDEKTVFTDISIGDIVGKYDIEFDAQALKSATREVKRNQLLQLINLAAATGVDPNNQQYFIDMKKLWSEVLESFELSQDLIMTTKEVVKGQTETQIAQAQAQAQVQRKTQEIQQKQM